MLERGERSAGRGQGEDAAGWRTEGEERTPLQGGYQERARTRAQAQDRAVVPREGDQRTGADRPTTVLAREESVSSGLERRVMPRRVLEFGESARGVPHGRERAGGLLQRGVRAKVWREGEQGTACRRYGEVGAGARRKGEVEAGGRGEAQHRGGRRGDGQGRAVARGEGEDGTTRRGVGGQCPDGRGGCRSSGLRALTIDGRNTMIDGGE